MSLLFASSWLNVTGRADGTWARSVMKFSKPTSRRSPRYWLGAAAAAIMPWLL